MQKGLQNEELLSETQGRSTVQYISQTYIESAEELLGVREERGGAGREARLYGTPADIEWRVDRSNIGGETYA